MAYAFSVSGPETVVYGTKRALYYVITETEVGTTSEWNISIPTLCTITLFEAELTTAGSAAQIDPDLGLASAWTADTLDEVAENATAGTYVKNDTDIRVTAPGNTLYGRSTPDDTADEIVTRITLIVGHE